MGLSNRRVLILYKRRKPSFRTPYGGFTFASKLIPCWNASSLCRGILKSCPSSTRLYFVFPGISEEAIIPQDQRKCEDQRKRQTNHEPDRKLREETNSGPFRGCFSSRRSVPTSQRGKCSSGPPETTCMRAGTATQDDRRVFLTFPAVNAWKRSSVGPASSCPGHSARRERRRDWRSAGDPPASIGTEARRGCVEEGLEVWDLPPSD